MPAVKIVLADTDKYYLEDLKLYIDTNHKEAKTTCYYDICSFQKYLQELDNPEEIIAAGLPFYEMINNEKKASTVLLSATPYFSSEHRERVIFKYQNAETIIKALLHTNSSQRKDQMQSLRPAKIVAFYSPQGGSGKTTAALGASILSSWEGKKVFYLNMESHSSSKAFLSGNNEQCLSHVLYHLKESKANMMEKLEKAKCYDTFYRIDYYLPPQSILDLSEDMTDEIRTLLGGLRSSGQYDLIFIDMETCFDRKNLALLEEADVIILIAVQCPLSNMKLQGLIEQLQLFENSTAGSLLNKTRFIINKEMSYMNKGVGDLAVSGISIFQSIPFVKDLLKSREDGLWRPDMNSSFANSIHVLLKSL